MPLSAVNNSVKFVQFSILKLRKFCVLQPSELLYLHALPLTLLLKNWTASYA